jgi:hypothetical protein
MLGRRETAEIRVKRLFSSSEKKMAWELLLRSSFLE